MQFPKNRIFWILFIGFSFYLASCKKCEPYRSSSKMSAEWRNVVPYKQGDTLTFQDQSRKTFLLVCNSKSVKQDGYSSTGHHNECEDSYMSWKYLQADLTGDLISDYGGAINLMLRLGDASNNEGVLGSSNNCNLRIGRYPLYFIFSSSGLAQGAQGFLESPTSPELKNFAFRTTVSLNGKQFQDVNLQSFEQPGSETICPLPEASGLGIDSIYYSAQYGLIRLTTIGGKKYQRIL